MEINAASKCLSEFRTQLVVYVHFETLYVYRVLVKQSSDWRRHMLPPLADVAASLGLPMQMLPWLLVRLPVASILNCYALDNLNTRRRKNKTCSAGGGRDAEGDGGKGGKANAIADRLLDQCGRLGCSQHSEAGRQARKSGRGRGRDSEAGTEAQAVAVAQPALAASQQDCLYKVEACVEPPSW